MPALGIASENIVSLSTGKALSDNTPSITQGSLTEGNSPATSKVWAIDELTNLSLTVEFRALNAFKMSSPKLTLNRGSTSTDIVNVTVSEGSNSHTATLTPAIVNSIRNVTGAVSINLVFGTVAIPVGFLSIENNAVLLGNPLFDSLWAKEAGQPTADTTERLVINPAFPTSQEIRLTSEGQILSTFTITRNTSHTVTSVEYTITLADWTAAYTANTANTELEMDWEYTPDGGTTWSSFYKFSAIK